MNLSFVPLFLTSRPIALNHAARLWDSIHALWKISRSFPSGLEQYHLQLTISGHFDTLVFTGETYFFMRSALETE